MNHRNWELLIVVSAVLIAALSPMWYLASSRGLDETIKSGAGVAQVGAIVGIYKLWKAKT